MNITKLLEPYIDLKYQKFEQKICPTKYKILGVKIPILRKITTALLKNNDYEIILKNINNNHFEEVMIAGLVIAKVPITYQKRKKLITQYLNKIDNWAICDTFCNSLKSIIDDEDDFFNYLNQILEIKKEFYQRFVIVNYLNYYINEKYIDKVLANLLKIKTNEYYVKMAISWCLSTCLSKNFNITIKFMQENQSQIDKWTYNKALQKGIESYQISEGQKAILRSLKIK